MRISILAGNGEEEVVKENLAERTLDDRLRRAFLSCQNYPDGNVTRYPYPNNVIREELPIGNVWIPHRATYETPDRTEIDVYGPHGEVPKLLVYADEQEKEEEKQRQHWIHTGGFGRTKCCQGHKQNHIVVQDDGVYVTRVEGTHFGYEGNIRTRYLQTAFLGDEDSALWETVLEESFEWAFEEIPDNYHTVGDYKAIYESEKGKEKILSLLDKYDAEIVL